MAVPKYQPLADYLAALPPELTRITLPLRQIEVVLGEPLPRQASTAVWWSNTPRLQHARAWMGAGWYVTARSLRSTPATITFERGADSVPQPFAPRRRRAPQAGRARRRGGDPIGDEEASEGC